MERAVAGDPAAIIAAINDAWLHGRYEELKEYFHPDVVLARPGFASRTIGRDALIDSYRELAAEGTIHSFSAAEPHVDAAGDSAVTTTRWTMDYSAGGQRSVEHGWDLLVFGKRDGRWVVIWRTVVTEG